MSWIDKAKKRLAEEKKAWDAAGKHLDELEKTRKPSKPPEPTGTCDQWGCTDPTYGHNRQCNTHIACM